MTGHSERSLKSKSLLKGYDALKKNILNVAVQVRSSNDVDMALTAEDRRLISNDLKPAINAFWLPPIAKDRKENTTGFELNSTILIFALGVGFASLIKPFAESVAKEAGKDFWTHIKKLTANIWNKQSQKAYQMSSKTYVFFELKDEYVAICLRLDNAAQAELTIENIEHIISNQLEELNESWDMIQSDIEKWNIGTLQQSMGMQNEDKINIHIISNTGEKWTIYPQKTWDFFGVEIDFRD